MPVLRKANSHSVDICRLIKNQQCKRIWRRKTDSNFDLSQAAKCSRCLKKKWKYVVHVIELSLHTEHNKVDPSWP